MYQGKECVRILDLRVQVHPGELWISKQRVHIVLEASKTGFLKNSGCKRWCPKVLRVRAPAAPALTHSLQGEDCFKSCFLLRKPDLYQSARFYVSIVLKLNLYSCSDFILYRKVGRRKDFEKGEAKHGIPILHPLLLCQDSSLSISGSSRKVFTPLELQTSTIKAGLFYNVKKGLSFITSKSLSKNLSNSRKLAF